MPIRTLIIEDESDAIELITSIIENNCPELQVIGTAVSVEKAIEAIIKLNPELVLMDVSLGNKKCFEILEHFKNPSFALVFTTAYANYALDAFKQDAIHYVLKPYSISELRKMTEKVYKTLRKSGKQIAVSTIEGPLILNSDEIIFLQANRAYCNVTTKNNKVHLLSKSLMEMEILIDMPTFIRTHISYTVNMIHVSKILNDSSLEMQTGHKIPVSRSNKNKIKSYFGINNDTD